VAGGGGALSGLRFGLLSCSSTRGPDQDVAGDALAAGIAAAGGALACRALLPDDAAAIAALLRQWADTAGCEVILTTGGTGLGPSDVTPEATAAAGDRPVPGIAELLRLRGLEQTPYAALGRGIAVLRGRTLIVNLPGSTAGAVSGLQALLPLLAHAAKMAHGGGHG